jgi:nicotinamide-nucleotide amidase
MNVSIVSIGDELLIGQVVNTNASWLGQTLTAAGCSVRSVVAVGDDHDAIATALRRAAKESAIVITSGGLGPTEDDLTRGTICRLLGCDLVYDNDQLARIEKRFTERGYEVNERSRRQALVPSACRVIPNEFGSAPGLSFELDGSTIYVLPGVPSEMKGIVTTRIIPEIARDRRVERADFLVFGPTESELAHMLEDVNPLLGDGITLAYLPSPGGIRLRLLAIDSSEGVRERFESITAMIRKVVAGSLVAEEDTTLQVVLGRMLKEKGATLATAESCTGGRIGEMLTDAPGSSAYYLGGVVAYANSAKIDLLGVVPATIEREGAVSRRTAEEMAEGARRRFASTIAIATTGIAGPDGGTPEKPVGTVWIAVSSESRTVALSFSLGGERAIVRQRASAIALDMARRELLKGGGEP